MAALLNKASTAVVASGRAANTRPAPRAVVCRAQAGDVDRRAVLGMIAASTPLLASGPAFAAYGDSANVFGKVTNRSGFVPYQGDDFVILLPSKWNPSKERDFEGVVLRYEDNFDLVNSLVVIELPTDKTKIEDLGSVEDALNNFTYLLGKQSYNGETLSEGGFAPNRVSAAAILDIGSETDRKGKTYYKYEILTRTADGDEGGRHQLIKATISNGKLYILKVQAGDKRWFKGAKRECQGSFDSFTVV